MDNQNNFNAATPAPAPNPAPTPAASANAPIIGAAPAQQPTQPYNGTGSIVAPAIDPTPIELSQRDHHRHTGTILLVIGLVIAVLATFTFIGLFIWMYLQYDDVSTDVEGQISQAVATAVNENSMKLEEDFLEREKEPNRTFSGPEDYGELTFEYPKTWSVYIQSDAANGGNFQAYFSPKEVQPINESNPNALRLTITTQSFDSVSKTYESYVNSGRMTMKVININGQSANLYTGQLTNKFSGAVCLIKIRDKTVLLQTDSELYMDDYNKLLTTVTYNS